MPRPKSKTLTEREAQIMEVLWDQPGATAEAIRAALPRRLHDSTVRTLLRVLETKGFAKHRTQGKSYLYHPTVPRSRAQGHAVANLLKRLFGGSAEDLVLRLLENEQITPEQLDAIRRKHDQGDRECSTS